MSGFMDAADALDRIEYRREREYDDARAARLEAIAKIVREETAARDAERQALKGKEHHGGVVGAAGGGYQGSCICGWASVVRRTSHDALRVLELHIGWQT